jgi:hypothetical protein
MPNFDEKTGIRYGVISPHAISQYALSDIYTNGDDPHYEYQKNEIERDYKNDCEEKNIPFNQDDLDILIQDMSDCFENPDGQMDYSDSEYDLHVSGDNFGIFVMRSPYYTYCRGCSPCAPGAGDLNSPITDKDQLADCMSLKTIFSAGKALCLGHEWFDQDNDQYSRKIPYRVFRVSDDSEVLPGDQS